MSLGKAIAHHRKQQGLSQRDLAEKLDVSQSYLARWETDRVRPRPEALEKVASALGVSSKELLVGLDDLLLSGLEVKDLELVELIRKIPDLAEHHQKALKIVLESMVTRNQIEKLVSPSPATA